MDDDRSTAAEGPALQGLSASLADLHRSICEARPDRVDSAVHGRILTCVLEGGLTAQEIHLVELGREADARAFREQLLRAAADQLRWLIKASTGRLVNAWAPVFEPRSGLTTLVFVLDAPVAYAPPGL